MAGLAAADMEVDINGAGARLTGCDIKMDGKSVDLTPARPPNGVMQQKPDPAGRSMTIDVDDIVDETVSDSFVEALSNAYLNGTAVRIERITKWTGVGSVAALQNLITRFGPFYVESMGSGWKKGGEVTGKMTLKGSGGAIPAAI